MENVPYVKKVIYDFVLLKLSCITNSTQQIKKKKKKKETPWCAPVVFILHSHTAIGMPFLVIKSSWMEFSSREEIKGLFHVAFK